MLMLIVAATVLIALESDAEARWRLFRRWRGSGGSYSQTGYNTSLYGTKRIDEYTQSICQRKANDMARAGRWFHDGSGFGNGWAEGVGSGGTPEQACSSCCDFNGVIIGQATAQSANGTWFACTIYGN
jgi:hypothetical protein